MCNSRVRAPPRRHVSEQAAMAARTGACSFSLTQRTTHLVQVLGDVDLLAGLVPLVHRVELLSSSQPPSTITELAPEKEREVCSWTAAPRTPRSVMLCQGLLTAAAMALASPAACFQVVVGRRATRSAALADVMLGSDGFCVVPTTPPHLSVYAYKAFIHSFIHSCLHSYIHHDTSAWGKLCVCACVCVCVPTGSHAGRPCDRRSAPAHMPAWPPGFHGCGAAQDCPQGWGQCETANGGGLPGGRCACI
jgi:hypothetical protein